MSYGLEVFRSDSTIDFRADSQGFVIVAEFYATGNVNILYWSNTPLEFIIIHSAVTGYETPVSATYSGGFVRVVYSPFKYRGDASTVNKPVTIFAYHV